MPAINAPFALSQSKGSPRVGMRGFTYIGLMFLIVLLGILLAAAGTLWQTEARREQEKQLLFVGRQYQQAIASYHAIQVNGAQQYPSTLENLLEDRRGQNPAMPVRHLRKRYPDPVTNSNDWGIVREAGGIVAIHSLSTEKPIKRSGFPSCCENFASAERYSDWRFVGRAGQPQQ